jgi:hypothetical protein
MAVGEISAEIANICCQYLMPAFCLTNRQSIDGLSLNSNMTLRHLPERFL